VISLSGQHSLLEGSRALVRSTLVTCPGAWKKYYLKMKWYLPLRNRNEKTHETCCPAD
jgi:hypothetical protein